MKASKVKLNKNNVKQKNSFDIINKKATEVCRSFNVIIKFFGIFRFSYEL